MKETPGKFVEIIKRKGSEYKAGITFFAIVTLAIVIINILAQFGFGNEMMHLIMSTTTFVVAFFVFYMTVEDRKESRKTHAREREEDKQIRIQERKEDREFQLEVLERIDKWFMEAQARHEETMRFIAEQFQARD